MQIGHELLAAAGRANTATCTVSLAERKTWFSNAARMFYNSPEGVTIAARCLLTSLQSQHTTCHAYHSCALLTNETKLAWQSWNPRGRKGAGNIVDSSLHGSSMPWLADAELLTHLLCNLLTHL